MLHRSDSQRPRNPRRRNDLSGDGGRRIRPGRSPQGRVALVEFLEDRCLLALVSWTSPAAGAWEVGSNWSNGTGPGAGDDVVIDLTGISVTHASGSDAVKSLTVNDPFTLSGGSLAVGTPTAPGILQAQNGNVFTLSGGTLRDAAVAAGTTLVSTSATSTLDDVTLGASLHIESAINVTDTAGTGAGLTLASGGSVMMDPYTGLTFAGTQTLAGSGTVSAQYGSGIGLSGTNQTLTIAAGITFKSSGSGLNVGANSLINEGTLSGDASLGPGGGSLTINGTNWVNDGTIEAINGGPVSLSGSWSNSGTISLNGNTVNLGGTMTPATLGTVSRDAASPGVLNLVGTLNLSGQTLDSSIGPLTLAGGTINGGTISDTILASYGTLNDVTVSGLLHIVSSLSVTDTARTGAGLTLASGGSVIMDAYTGLTFAGTQTLAGSGTVSAQYGSGIGLSGTSQTLTIAAGITFKSSGSGLNVGANTLINEGTLSGDTSVGPGGGSLTVNGTNWVNDGTIEAINGGPVSLSGSWSNSGTISLNGNTVNLGGAITPATLGTVSRDATNPGVLNLVGTLNLSGQTLDSSIGPLTLAGGTINGGTISDTILASYGTLNDVTVSGLLHIVSSLSVTDTASTGEA